MEYHKIDSVFKRDTKGRLLLDEYTCPEFAYLADNQWLWSEKVDGTNVRVMWRDGVLRFGGRTDAAQMPTPLLNALNALVAPERLRDVFRPGGLVTLYGEGYGPGIQKSGGNYRKDVSFVLFDVLIDEWWLTRADVHEIGEKLGVDVVPSVGAGSLHQAIDMVRAGFTSTWGTFPAEGLVMRPSTELRRRNGDRIITKIKTRDFQ